ncbi:(2Fe-2S)-binding protein [Mesorhizobium sp. WSM4307]|uniref:(2Fe-2S)-binding protein n=1 Tax=unclassified Mesorhizobium TaxID=325217 RepID=UPI000BB0684D|nr:MULTISPECIES: (2Fe-2S)-binding protein [unclassified Mesorhizobium]PBB24478.1 sarcosine oxidase subunit alpha [Mesorhizobium sp. WSM4304]PBB74553.1 sarcosine oxidase subunit alpha [Mesorhizobium sp. WSM4308]TRC73281.1 (2Fe-2S)-binding protein [Mesorhizobium sp. WSM4315]TRC83560.1 (2Fe-2S)-binding protein [Mesorhizobium sp. WSM4307]
MFRRLRTDDLSATIFLDGRPVQCRPGDSVAAALLAAGVDRFRTTPVSGADRMPYCMIGNCFDCLVEIDGQADRQACLVPTADGMQVRSQLGSGRFDIV